jgi:Flp pilus assembly protein TadG
VLLNGYIHIRGHAMPLLKSIARRARRFDKRGNVAIMFALAGSATVTLIGGTIELSRISSSVASLNAAADVAALAAKRVQMDNSLQGNSISQAAGVAAGQKVFAAAAPSPDKGITNASAIITWDADGSSRVAASGTMNLIIGGALGISTVPVNAIGVATAGADKELEVTMLLDTTASMFSTDGRPSTRFTQMRTAAKSFVNTLFDTVTVPNRLRVAVIPWTTTVNIKSETPSAWSSAAGTVRSPADYGTRVLPTTTINRTANLNQSASTLTTQFAPVGWRGCVSGTGESLTANDNAMTNMKWNALRVQPLNRQTTTQDGKSVSGWCDNWQGCGGTSPPPPPSGTQGNLGKPTKQDRSFAFLNFGKNTNQVACVNNRYSCTVNQCNSSSPSTSGLDCWQESANGTKNAFFNHSGGANCRWGGCQTDLNPQQAWGCTADYNEVTWNNGGGNWCWFVDKSEWTSFKPISGPNLNCPMPMLGLSGNRGQLIDTIDRLSPSPGGTHADVGLRWGLRSLSPKAEWTSFFGHTAPKAFGGNQASKVMILMTDGANEQAVNFPGYWGCSDTTAAGCSGSPDRATLDARMLSWCNEIRNTYKVELYTVAVNVTDTTAVNLLKQCVGNDNTRAFAVDASELSATFATIARSTFALRIKE